MMIWRMRIACCIPKATKYTHSGCVMLIASPLQQWLHESASLLRYMYVCLSVCQYTETNVMHFSFNLLRIKGLYMFRALLAHPQEALHKWHLVYCVRIMSVGCGTVAVNSSITCSSSGGATQWHKCQLAVVPLCSAS
jgi:hypothetical protein